MGVRLPNLQGDHVIMSDILDDLVNLTQSIAREERQLAILGEGNTSADAGDGTFWVKGSGCQMSTIKAGDFARVKYDDALAVLEEEGLDNQMVNKRISLHAFNRSQANAYTGRK